MGGGLGGGKVESGEPAGDHAVHLFGERLGEVVGAQAGFDMGHRDSLVEPGEGSAEGSGGVALNDDEIGALGCEDGLEGGQNPRGGLEQGLAGEHQVEVMVRGDVERGENLIEHLAVLAGDADADGELLLAQVQDDRAEFNGLRAGAEDDQDFAHRPSGGSGGGGLLVAVGDAALGKVVGRHFQGDSVACQYADAVAAEFSGEVGQDGAVLIELYAEQTAGELFDDGSGDFNTVFFTHCPRLSWGFL